jgi:hypothetical protein
VAPMPTQSVVSQSVHAQSVAAKSPTRRRESPKWLGFPQRGWQSVVNSMSRAGFLEQRLLKKLTPGRWWRRTRSGPLLPVAQDEIPEPPFFHISLDDSEGNSLQWVYEGYYPTPEPQTDQSPSDQSQSVNGNMPDPSDQSQHLNGNTPHDPSDQSRPLDRNILHYPTNRKTPSVPPRLISSVREAYKMGILDAEDKRVRLVHVLGYLFCDWLTTVTDRSSPLL